MSLEGIEELKRRQGKYEKGIEELKKISKEIKELKMRMEGLKKERRKNNLIIHGLKVDINNVYELKQGMGEGEFSKTNINWEIWQDKWYFEK